jgi:hypothetical protein
MKVFIEVPYAGSLLLGERNYRGPESRFPPLNVALVKALVSRLFKRFFEANLDTSLKELVCYFSELGRKGAIFYWPVRVKRLERDDAPLPAEGSFTVECGHDHTQTLGRN